MLIVGSATLEATKGHRIVATTLPVHELHDASCILRLSCETLYTRRERNNDSKEMSISSSKIKIKVLFKTLLKQQNWTFYPRQSRIVLVKWKIINYLVFFT